MTVTTEPTTPTLTPDQRQRLVDKLCADLVEGANRASLLLWDMAHDGFVGFSKRTDAELLEAHVAAFDEDFLQPEDESEGSGSYGPKSQASSTMLAQRQPPAASGAGSAVDIIEGGK